MTNEELRQARQSAIAITKFQGEGDHKAIAGLLGTMTTQEKSATIDAICVLASELAQVTFGDRWSEGLQKLAARAVDDEY